MTDWTRSEEEADQRRCGTPDTPELLGCLLLGLMLALGVIVGWAGYHWIVACP